jgi:hypothetical protein
VRRFVPALRRISSELDVPAPVRARIVLEMAADLEGLYEHYRAQGLEEEEAVRRTEERLLASPEALRHLVVVHTTGLQRWLSRAAAGARRGFEVLLLLAGALPIVLVALWTTAGQLGGMAGEPFLWPLLGMVGLVTGLLVWKAVQLFFTGVRTPGELRAGLPALLFLGVVGPAVGGAAFFSRLYGVALSASRPGGDALAAVGSLGEAAALLSLGLLLGLAAGLVWAVLVNRVAAVEEAESAALLAE